MRRILASQSPRRQELLRLIYSRFEVVPADADETLPGDMSPREAVEYLAALKAGAVAGVHPHDLVIGADTVVAIDNKILGKPRDRAQAADMLRSLSGRTHEVYTGVAVRSPKGDAGFSVCTEVEFYPLDEHTISWYLETGEYADKAGAYGIQGYGSLLVGAVRGDYFNVVGLPVARLWRELRRLELWEAGAAGLSDS